MAAIKKDKRVLGPGPFRLKEILIVRSNEVLEISPETTIMLAPDVGIYCEGQVLAGVSKKAPIRIVAAEESDPESKLSLNTGNDQQSEPSSKPIFFPGLGALPGRNAHREV